MSLRKKYSNQSQTEKKSKTILKKCSKCKSRFNNVAQMNQHIRRQTCRGNFSKKVHKCDNCERSFNTYPGLRLHQRRAHPIEYNNDLVEESSASKRRWTREEDIYLAKLESKFCSNDPHSIINYLVSISSRSRNAIKKRRHRKDYIALVATLRDKLQYESSSENEADTNPSININESNSTTFLFDFNENNNKLIKEANDKLRQTLSSIKLSENDSIIRDNIVSSTLQEGREILENWSKVNLIDKSKTPIDALSENYKITKKTSKVIKDFVLFRDQPSIVDNEKIKVMNDEFSISQPITKKDIHLVLSNTEADDLNNQEDMLLPLDKISMELLLFLFNAMLLLNYAPNVLKQSHIKFISNSTDKENIKRVEWKAIISSSLILRVFHMILFERLSVIPLNNNNQKFRKLNKSFQDGFGLFNIMREFRYKAKPISVVSFDISKSFESVSHFSVLRALKRLGVESKIVEYIKQNFDGLTAFYIMKNKLNQCPIKRGLKQIDSLSSILFDAVLDELVYRLNKFFGIKIDVSQKLCCWRYTDKLFLFSSDRDDCQRMVNIVKNFFDNRGMQLNIENSKSLILRTVPSKKKLYVDNTEFTCGRKSIPMVSVKEHAEFLGVEFMPL